MKKLFTLTAAAAALLAATLPANAQITLDGVINANEIGSGKYQSLGAFTTPHADGVSFGKWGMLHLYGATANGKLYLAIAGTVQQTGNNFQLYLDLPSRSGVPAATAFPGINGPGTVFNTIDTDKTYAGVKMDMETDLIVAMTGQGDVQGAVFTSATTATAQSLMGGAGILLDGTMAPFDGPSTTGTYAPFAGGKAAYLAATGDITTNPGEATGGGAGSYGLEMELDLAALGVTSGGTINVMAAQVSGDAYWSSDVIPEIPGNGNGNLAFHPDLTALAGTQAAPLSVVTGVRAAADAAVALQVAPNPATTATTVQYQVRAASQPVTVQVLDLLGRAVLTQPLGSQAVGAHAQALDTRGLVAGPYLVRVQVGEQAATRRLVVR